MIDRQDLREVYCKIFNDIIGIQYNPEFLRFYFNERYMSIGAKGYGLSLPHRYFYTSIESSPDMITLDPERQYDNAIAVNMAGLNPTYRNIEVRRSIPDQHLTTLIRFAGEIREKRTKIYGFNR